MKWNEYKINKTHTHTNQIRSKREDVHWIAKERGEYSDRHEWQIDVWTFILFRLVATNKHTQVKFKQNHEIHKKWALNWNVTSASSKNLYFGNILLAKQIWMYCAYDTHNTPNIWAHSKAIFHIFYRCNLDLLRKRLRDSRFITQFK